ncbi:MAG: LuxR C-terminal-related transcriptional regulator [Pseudomonadota bacterium]
MDTKSNITKLTEREKEALRLWLDHKTAKETARDLGISHHAVEKRLKMARTKLGVSSSREAARLLAEREGYGDTVAHASELPTRDKIIAARKPLFVAIGGLSMLFATTLALVSLAQSPTASDTASGTVTAELEEALSAEVRQARDAFQRLDRNGSGYIEKDEFVSPFSHLLFSSDAVDKDQQVEPIYFEASEVKVAPFDGDDLDRVIVTLDDEDTRMRRQIMFTLIDRNEDERLDESEFTMAHLDGIAPRTFKFELDQEDG